MIKTWEWCWAVQPQRRRGKSRALTLLAGISLKFLMGVFLGVLVFRLAVDETGHHPHLQRQQQLQNPAVVAEPDDVPRQVGGPWTTTTTTTGPSGRVRKKAPPPSAKTKKKLLLVGVMTSGKSLATRGCAVARTWARHLSGPVVGDVLFYAEGDLEPGAEVGACSRRQGPPESDDDDDDHVDMKVVRLAGVENAYPPQKKSFMMLKHMHDHHLDHYHWFLRADDDLFVNFNVIHDFVRSIRRRRRRRRDRRIDGEGVPLDDSLDDDDDEELLFIGQPGIGLPEERESLGLFDGQNFCMGGPGMLLSDRTLAALRPHLRGCLRQLVTFHEDVELGRCVFRSLEGKHCTKSKEMADIFRNFHPTSKALSSLLQDERRILATAATLHPFKDPLQMHQAYLRALVHLRGQQVSQVAEIRRQLLEEGSDDDDDGQLDPAAGVWDTHMNGAAYGGLGTSGRLAQDARLRGLWREPLEESLGVALELQLNQEMYEKGRRIRKLGLNYGYSRSVPDGGKKFGVGGGVRHVLDFNLRLETLQKRPSSPGLAQEGGPPPGGPTEGGGATWPTAGRKVRKHVHLWQGFLPLRLDPRPSEQALLCSGIPGALRRRRRRDDPEVVVVNMIVPLYAKSQRFAEFLANYRDQVVKVDLARVTAGGSDASSAPITTTTRLIVVLFVDDPEDSEGVSRQLRKLRRDSLAPSGHHAFEYRLVVKQEPFARARALHYGTQAVPGDDLPEDNDDDELVFFIDVDIQFNRAALDTARILARRRRAVYFPIVFSTFRPRGPWGAASGGNSSSVPPPDRTAVDYYDLGSARGGWGFWRAFGFGMAAFYRNDYSVSDKYLSIRGWGLEDVDFHDHFLKETNLRVVRAPDPDLVHRHHGVICDPDALGDKYAMCVKSRANNNLSQLEAAMQLAARRSSSASTTPSSPAAAPPVLWDQQQVS